MTPTIGVLRRGTHGMPIEEYVTALRERLGATEIRLARTPAEERDLVRECEIVTGMEIEAGLLDEADELRWFACAYAGVGHLPLDELREQGVVVTNASGVHGPNIGEYVVGAILSFVRDFGEARRRPARREWRHFQAGELQGSTVTIVGMGAIGQAVVERLEGFGVETVGVRYTPERGGPTDEVVGLTDEDALQEALSRTDHLVLACPLTDETRGLIGTSELKTLPPDAVLVNVARGPVVDTDALVTALRGNRLKGAALDVTDPEPLPEVHPLWNLGNVLITPHNAGHTPRYYERLADIVAENVEHVIETGSYEGLENQVEL